MPEQRTGGSGGAPHRVVRFGVFELDAGTGELRKQGVRLKLQGKPLQVLQALLENPGQIVTREELRRRLWPSDIFIDFDSGLNTAANRLRIALGDSAESPRYVETLARTGYRFIAPIEVVEPSPPATPARPTAPRRFGRLVPVAFALGTFATVLAAVLALREPSPAAARFRQVTFRRGQVSGARFAPDGQAILYTATWDDGPRQLFVTNPVSPESRPLGFPDRTLVSVSRSGELALLAIDGAMPITGGSLSRVPMNGGAPMPVERNVMSADWAPEGSELAIVRAIEGVNQLELPPGRVLYKTSGWIGSVRVSRRAGLIAFIEHPVRNDDRGSVRVLEPGRPARTLSGEWTSAGGLAWHPSGSEVWFTATRDRTPKSLWAVTLSGAVRPIAQTAGAMTLRDIAPDGRALVARETRLLEMAGLVEGEARERNLSWLDWSRVADVSADGRLILFDEGGTAAGEQYLVYLHRMDERSTVRLGEGQAMALSPDGRFALTLSTKERTRLALLPLGDGKPTALPPAGIEYQWARYFPDGRRLLALASEPGQPLRLYVQPLDGRPFPITPPTVVRNVALSPDGTKVALFSADRKLIVYATTGPGGPGRVVSTPEPLAPLLWAENDWVHVQHVGAYTQIPTRISRLHLPTGRLQPWKDVRPADTLGVNAITKVMLSRDTRTCVFNYRRVLSELFVVDLAAR